MSFFPPQQRRSPRAVAPDVEDRRVERSPEVGRFPNELGVPVSVPSAVMVFEQIASAFDEYRVFPDGFFMTMRVLHRDPTVDGFDRRISDSLSNDPDRVPWGAELMLGLEMVDGRKGYVAAVEVDDADFGILFFWRRRECCRGQFPAVGEHTAGRCHERPSQLAGR